MCKKVSLKNRHPFFKHCFKLNVTKCCCNFQHEPLYKRHPIVHATKHLFPEFIFFGPTVEGRPLCSVVVCHSSLLRLAPRFHRAKLATTLFSLLANVLNVLDTGLSSVATISPFLGP